MHTFAQKPKATQQATSAKSTMPSRAHFGQSNAVSSILHLQRTIGNQTVQRLLQARTEDLEASSVSSASTGFAYDFSRIPIHTNAHTRKNIQPKLKVNTQGDIYEQEADRVADQVMRMPEPQLQRAWACGGECPKCRKKQSGQQHLQTKIVQGHDAEETIVSPVVQEVISSPGQSLDSTTREFMESRFGHDFSRVRVHTDARAAESTRTVNAQAYTVGRDVVFGAEQYTPGTNTGKSLLAHELTHVVQQRGPNGKNERPTTGNANDAHEQEASRVANSLMYQHLDTRSKMPIVRRAFNPTIMRSLLFTSTMEICRSLLESRVFHVSQGGIRVTVNAAYERRGRPECSSADYHMTLNQKGRIFDSDYGTCEFPQGQIFSRQWKNLPAGDYNLTIWTNNTNPYCCLVGDIIVDQQSGLQGDSCTQPPPGPLQVMHLALDLAGLIPGVGVVADGANLIIYAAEGDWTNAGISAVSLVPVIGGAALVMRRGRQVVRVSGEVVEQMGRSRMTSALRRARGSRQAAGAAGEAGESARRRMFAQRNPTIADPSLPPGSGSTDRFGNMTISSAGSATDQALARYHEQVHSFLSPRLNFLRNFRANVGMAAYQRSALLQYIEEALAETYAQLRVHGIRNLPNGIRFPIREGYVTLRAVVTEAAIGTVLFGGLTYGVYIWASQKSAPETP